MKHTSNFLESEIEYPFFRDNVVKKLSRNQIFVCLNVLKVDEEIVEFLDMSSTELAEKHLVRECDELLSSGDIERIRYVFNKFSRISTIGGSKRLYYYPKSHPKNSHKLYPKKSHKSFHNNKEDKFKQKEETMKYSLLLSELFSKPTHNNKRQLDNKYEPYIKKVKNNIPNILAECQENQFFVPLHPLENYILYRKDFKSSFKFQFSLNSSSSYPSNSTCLLRCYSRIDNKHEWPLSIIINVNSNIIRLAKKSRLLPIDITNYCKYGTNNSVSVDVNPDSDHSFYLQIVKNLSVDDIISNILAKQRWDTQTSKKFIEKSFVESVEIVEVSRSLALIDNWSKQRIKIPVRSSQCSHISCYDLSTWLILNSKTYKWECPLCMKKILLKDLFVDTYVEEILKDAPTDIGEVHLTPDATWTFKKKVETVIKTTISLDSDDDSSTETNDSHKNQKVVEVYGKVVELIDLTQEDIEEESEKNSKGELYDPDILEDKFIDNIFGESVTPTDVNMTQTDEDVWSNNLQPNNMFTPHTIHSQFQKPPPFYYNYPLNHSQSYLSNLYNMYYPPTQPNQQNQNPLYNLTFLHNYQPNSLNWSQ